MPEIARFLGIIIAMYHDEHNPPQNECAYLLDAEYRCGFKVFVRFSTGEAGEIDLAEIISKHKAAAPLRDKKAFSQFCLDSWPTLAWKCGFDIAPEVLLNRLKAGQQQCISG